MEATAISARYEDVAPMREAYRAEAACQIVSDSAMGRGFSDPYLLKLDGATVGYGGVYSKYYEGLAHEVWIEPSVREQASALFDALLKAGRATGVQVQTNLPLIPLLAWEFAATLTADRWVFVDGGEAGLTAPLADLALVEVPNASPNHPDSRDFALRLRGETVASGGYLCHYNPPFADVHMEVAPEFRGKGLGAYFVHEVMRAARANGKKPAARCNLDHVGSRSTLERAGFLRVGALAEGPLRKPTV